MLCRTTPLVIAFGHDMPRVGCHKQISVLEDAALSYELSVAFFHGTVARTAPSWAVEW